MICLGEGAVLDVTQCGHIACPSCLTAFYTQRDLAIYPLRCFACPKRIGIAELVRHSVLTSADADRAHKFNQLAKFRDSMHKYTSVECLRCHTSNKVRKDLHVHTLRCRDCKCRIDTTLAAAVCPYCSRHTSVKKGITKNLHCQYCSGVFDHSGGKIGGKVCKDDLAMLSKSLAGIEDGFGVCPRCSAGVMKPGGCHHMTCVCGAHFEWTSNKLDEHAALKSGRPQLADVLAENLQQVLEDEVALLTDGGP
jgi:hypothetical protein